MKHLTLIRFLFPEKATFGYINLGDKKIYTLERPYIDADKDGLSDPNVSCIKPSSYLAQYIESSASGKYKDTWWIRTKNHRKGILIHRGNYPYQTKGCILVGLNYTPSQLYDSRKAMDLLREYIGRNDFKLTIRKSGDL